MAPSGKDLLLYMLRNDLGMALMQHTAEQRRELDKQKKGMAKAKATFANLRSKRKKKK